MHANLRKVLLAATIMCAAPSAFANVIIDWDEKATAAVTSMAGAKVAGDVVACAQAACAAGCDTVLVCNDPDGVGELLSHWRPTANPDLAQRCAAMASSAARARRQGIAA